MLKKILISLSIIFFFLLGKQIYLYNLAPTQPSLRAQIDTYAQIIYLHIPFSPFEKKAIKNILQIAKKNKELELYAYEVLRATIYGIKHFSTPYKKILTNIEDKIAHLRAQKLLEDGYKKSYAESYAEMKTIMTKDLSPNSFLAFISILCFLFWIAISIVGIVKSSNDNIFNYKQFTPYLLVIIISWFIWITTLYLA